MVEAIQEEVPFPRHPSCGSLTYRGVVANSRRQSPRHLRNGQNVFAGWLLALGVAPFVLFFDPLFLLHGKRGPEETLDVLLPFTVGAALISRGGYRLFVSTNVEVTEARVVLRNPLREHRIPRAGLEVKPLTKG